MVKSAARVMQILGLVGESRDGVKHMDIAETLQIPKGSLSLLLSDLVEGEFLTFNPVDKRYRTGPQILSLAGRFLADMDIVKITQPVIRDLIAKTHESCGLGVRKGYNVMIVWKENSDEPLKWDLKIGDQYPMYASSFGKIFLAFMDEAELAQYLSHVELHPITENTITRPESLMRELEGIRAGAIAYSREENFTGIIAMGVPIFDSRRQVVASLSSPIPKMRFTPEKEKLMEDSLKKAGKMLSRELGFIA